MAMLLDILSWLCAAFGCFFLLAGAVGVLRLPDFFARAHAAGLIDTIAALFILAALLLQFGWHFKLAAMAALLLFINPATTHALCRSARFHAQQNQDGNH